MATYHDAKIKTAQAKEAVARAKARAPPPGPLLLVVALSLGCFLVSDYLLYTPYGDDGQPLDEEPVSLLQTYLWTSIDGWVWFSLARLLLSGGVFTVLCVGFACLLGCCGFRANQPPRGQQGV